MPRNQTGQQSISRKISAVVADDGPLACQRVVRMMERHADIEVVATCSDGGQTLHAVQRLDPDLLILEIGMPMLDEFGVIEQLGQDGAPHVIFLTAHDHFAARAFDVQAIDYLLKPVDEERFDESLDRARCRLEIDEQRSLVSRLAHLVREGNFAERYLRRLIVKKGDATIILRMEHIEWFESAENYVRIHVGRQQYLLRHTLAGLEKKLDPNQFVRVHRTAIVNIEHMAMIERPKRKDLVIVLGAGERVPLSRMYRWKLESAIGML